MAISKPKDDAYDGLYCTLVSTYFYYEKDEKNNLSGI